MALRPIGSLAGTIAGQWNRDFSSRVERIYNVRRTMRQNLTCARKGRGNRAWKRYEAMMRDPAYLVWPDYVLHTPL
mgnify:FL=1